MKLREYALSIKACVKALVINAVMTGRKQSIKEWI